MPILKLKCSINIWHSVSLPQVNTLGFGDRNVLSDADFVAVVIFTCDVVFGNAGAKWGCFSIMEGVEILFKGLCSLVSLPGTSWLMIYGPRQDLCGLIITVRP